MVSDGWLELVSGSKGPAEENFLFDYANENVVGIESMMLPVNQYPSDNLPDDITVFIVTKE